MDRGPAEGPVAPLNLQRVRARLELACQAANRSVDSVRLIAVSKTHPASAVRAAYAAGQRDFGESYAQELAEKAAQLADLEGIRWHFLGPLQRNKAKLVATHACSVHALESARVAALLPALDLFVQVNVSGEASKHGVTPADLPALLAELRGARVVGLMTLPPPDLAAARQAFETLAALASTHGLPRLSMGMSDDLEIAVAAGATDVRIGSAIFGERPPKPSA